MSVALQLAPNDPPAAAAPRDVVMILGYTSWGGAIRRGLVHPEDQLTLALLRSPRVGRLLVCNPFRSAPAKLMRAAIGPRDAEFPGSETRRLHEPLRVRRTDPTDVRGVERACAAYERSVRRAAARFGLERPVVITTHPLWAGFGHFDWAGPVTYYANDDLRAHPPLSSWWPAYDVSHAKMREHGRGAVGLTPKSLASVDPAGPSAVIPCGIDPNEWLAPGAAPGWFTALPGRKLLYVGTLDPRVEVESVAATAQAYPDDSIVLVGRCPDPEHYAAVRGLPNVTIASEVGREQLTALVAAADVGLIPHVRSEQTMAMSPLKLFEYLAAGLPVASVDLPGIRPHCPERVALAAGIGDFPTAVARAIEIGPCSEADRIAFVHDNTWARRFDQLFDIALAN
jgi:teichuronic acid biosynthesis glycosyltransferase TuaH